MRLFPHLSQKLRPGQETHPVSWVQFSSEMIFSVLVAGCELEQVLLAHAVGQF